MSARTVLSLRNAVGGTGPSPGPIGSPRSSTGFFYAPPVVFGVARGDELARKEISGR